MRILITGDSWGCGEWLSKDGDYHVAHNGIEQYLQDDGHEVVNLSVGGNNNLQSLVCMEHDVDAQSFDRAIFFFTDPLRHSKYDDFVRVTPKRLVQEHIDYVLQKLDECKIPVTVIGGCAKVVVYNYVPKNLTIIPSMTELIIKDFKDTEYMTSHEWENHWKKLGNSATSEMKEQIDDIATKAGNKYECWRQNPEYFWPDSLHANRKGIRIVYDHMLSLWNTD